MFRPKGHTGEGHYTGGTVPYGYKRVRLGRVNKKNQEVCDLVIDEAEDFPQVRLRGLRRTEVEPLSL